MPNAAAAVLASVETDQPDLVTLLQLSRAAHSQYQENKKHGLQTEAFQWLSTAARLRQLAHEKDPKHRDSLAWDADLALRFKHADMTAFYAKELLKNG